MKNTILNILSGILLLFFGFCIGLVTFPTNQREPVGKLIPVQSDIPSARQIQQSLKDLDNPRYDPGKVDGIPGPNTITAWDNLIEDRYAKREIEGE